MKIYQITDVERQHDWRFYDITAEVYEVPDEKVKKHDCSLCALRDGVLEGQVKIVLPFKYVKDIVGAHNG